MSWYKNGDWENLSLAELMICVRELMHAVNEREHAIGKREDDETGFMASRYLHGLNNPNEPYFNSVYEHEGEFKNAKAELADYVGQNIPVKNINGYTKWFCYAEGTANTYGSGEKEFEGLVEKAFPDMADFAEVQYPMFFQENLRRLCHSLTSVYLKQDGVSYHQTWMHMLTVANKIECEDAIIYCILTDKDESIWDTVLSSGLGFGAFKGSWPDRRELLDKPTGAASFDVKWDWMEYQGMPAWPWVGELRTVDAKPFIEIRNVLDKMKYIQTVVEFTAIPDKCWGKVACLPLVEASGGGIEYPKGEDCKDDYTELKSTFNALPLIPVYLDATLAPEGTVSGTILGDTTTLSVESTGVSGRDEFPEVTPFYARLGPIYREGEMEFAIYEHSGGEYRARCGAQYAGLQFVSGDIILFYAVNYGSQEEDSGVVDGNLTIPNPDEGSNYCYFTIKFVLDSGSEFPTPQEPLRNGKITMADPSSLDTEMIKVLEITSGGDWEIQRTDGNEYSGITKVTYVNPATQIMPGVYYSGSAGNCFVNSMDVTIERSAGHPERLFTGGYSNYSRMTITRFYSGKASFNIEGVELIEGQLKYIKADYNAKCVRPHTASLALDASGDWASSALPITSNLAINYFETSESIDATIPYVGCINDDSVLNCSLDLNDHVLDMPCNLEWGTREVLPYARIFKQDFAEDVHIYLKNSQAESTGDWETKGTSGALTRDNSLEISGDYSWKFAGYPLYDQNMFGQTVGNKFYLTKGWYRIRVQHKGDAFEFCNTNADRYYWDVYYEGKIMDCPASVDPTITETLIYVENDDPGPANFAGRIVFFRTASGKTIWIDGVEFFKVHGNDFLQEHSHDISGVDNGELSGGITLPYPIYDMDSLPELNDPSTEIYTQTENHPYTGNILSIGFPYYCAFERGNLDPIVAEGGVVNVQGNFQLPSDATVGPISGQFLITPIERDEPLYNFLTYTYEYYDRENYGDIASAWPNYNGIYKGIRRSAGKPGKYYEDDVFIQDELIYEWGFDWCLADREYTTEGLKLYGNRTSPGVVFWYKPELDSGEENPQYAYVAEYHGSLTVGRQLKLLYDVSGGLTFG